MSEQLTAETVATRSPRVVSEVIGRETLVLDPEADRYTKLNGSGAVLWEALSQPATVADLAAELVARFGIDESRALADTRTFLASVAEKQLVDLR